MVSVLDANRRDGLLARTVPVEAADHQRLERAEEPDWHPLWAGRHACGHHTALAVTRPPHQRAPVVGIGIVEISTIAARCDPVAAVKISISGERSRHEPVEPTAEEPEVFDHQIGHRPIAAAELGEFAPTGRLATGDYPVARDRDLGPTPGDYRHRGAHREPIIRQVPNTTGKLPRMAIVRNSTESRLSGGTTR